MKVMVCYDDESYDIIEDYCLEYLIQTGNIKGFCRSDKWVTVGVDPIRNDESACDTYEGPERRRSLINSVKPE